MTGPAEKGPGVKNQSEPAKVSIGDWTVFPSRGRIERNGASVSLEPLGMALLLYLAQHSDRVISTNELIDEVWSGQIVSDGTVYQWIHRLRKVLGDDSHSPRYIETIPKKGYRLLAEVKATELPVAVDAQRSRTARASVSALAALLISIGTVFYLVRTTTPVTTPPVVTQQIDEKSIAVLPFENLSADGDSYFASGIHNDLLSQLANIRSLKVISRTSVLEYENAPINLRDVGERLGVASILEGSVQRLGDSIRVNAQLIDAVTDTHIWAEVYDQELTAENLFAIQTDIATSIAEALQAVITPDDVVMLNEIPTESLRAYDFFLSGNDYYNRPGFEGVELAVQQYQRAVDEDPQFAQAWAQLSRAHILMAWSGTDRTESRSALALEAAERALDMAPDLAGSHIALGQYHYMAARDYALALQEYEVAAQLAPGNAELFPMRAFIQRRVGAWDAALENLSQAIALDPRNLDLLDQQAQNFRVLREYEQADELWNRVLEIAPDQSRAQLNKAINALYRGDPASEVRAALESLPTAGDEIYLRWLVALFERDYDRARVLLSEWDEDVFVDGLFFVPKASFHGVTEFLAGRHDDSRRWFEAAEEVLRDALSANPEDWRLYFSLGEVLAGLGEAEESVKWGQRALDRFPVESDTFSAHVLQTQAVLRVFIPAGDYDAALSELEAYFSVPGRWSINGLANDPRLDPVRDDPRFKAIVARYARP